MVAVIFCISYFFSRRAIRPVALAWEKQRQFVADASHELKTPLATMMANYDVVLSNETSTVESQKEWLGYLKTGMDRMNKLISSLLSLARLESDELLGEKSSFDASRLIAERIKQMESQAAERKLTVKSNLAEELHVKGNEQLTGQAFSILYDNALKYTDEGGTIEVSLRRDRKHAVCSVRNTGKGISPEDLPHIFDRFYRVDSARTGEDNSYGLGLSIASAIVEQLGGSLTATSQTDGWTEFILTLEA
ncbi:MAG: HAMP domain-containing histidine kinase [Coriobacteriia bacterium]|nr:HAMP domain-containing histidine kinase [Coriobacteriia bacterium]